MHYSIVLSSFVSLDLQRIRSQSSHPIILTGKTRSHDSTMSSSRSDDSTHSGSFTAITNNWQKGSLLGSGLLGPVYEAFTENWFFFAVKEVSVQTHEDQQSINLLEREIAILSQFQHKNIVQYLGTERGESRFYIFLELVPKGSLKRLYLEYQLSDTQVSDYTTQILRGLHYLHSQNVVHRDIRCANILVDVNGSVKLADFGLAKETTQNGIECFKGTPFWIAPEVINQNNNGYGVAADIWSVGCTVLEMLTGQTPYSNLETMQAVFKIGRGTPPPIPNDLSKDARDFISKCLQGNPTDRPTVTQLLDHPFVRS